MTVKELELRRKSNFAEPIYHFWQKLGKIPMLLMMTWCDSRKNTEEEGDKMVTLNITKLQQNNGSINEMVVLLPLAKKVCFRKKSLISFDRWSKSKSFTEKRFGWGFLHSFVIIIAHSFSSLVRFTEHKELTPPYKDMIIALMMNFLKVRIGHLRSIIILAEVISITNWSSLCCQ